MEAYKLKGSENEELDAREKFMKAEKGVGYLKLAMREFKDIHMGDDDFTYHIYKKLEQLLDEEDPYSLESYLFHLEMAADEEDTFIDHEADLRFEAIP
jgi:hypothetical protein